MNGTRDLMARMYSQHSAAVALESVRMQTSSTPAIDASQAMSATSSADRAEWVEVAQYRQPGSHTDTVLMMRLET